MNFPNSRPEPQSTCMQNVTMTWIQFRQFWNRVKGAQNHRRFSASLSLARACKKATRTKKERLEPKNRRGAQVSTFFWRIRASFSGWRLKVNAVVINFSSAFSPAPRRPAGHAVVESHAGSRHFCFRWMPLWYTLCRTRAVIFVVFLHHRGIVCMHTWRCVEQ